jgi:N6-adenosine-specific RNA methylase IME4
MKKKYEVIYADPPWRYTPAVKNRRIENHYPTMALKEIMDMEIPCEKNSVLYLWATASKLPDCLKVMEAWGFKYKSQLVWDKEIIGMGYWMRGQHELLLIGTKGKFSPPIQADRISSVWRERRTRHSKKPNGIRDCIKNWFPNAKRLEMFCRYPSDGWDVFGNEVDDSIKL